ncbi:MAG TPA: nuclear transport factor 2 family protein [Terriglobales bacterium]|nr:nuclear transport factor 2 family protein [Terriglobales bacterium]
MRPITLAFLILTCAAAWSQARDTSKDEQTLLQLENDWYHSRSVATLGRIYAPDFWHIVADGQMFSGKDEIEYLKTHPQPKQDESRRKFEDVKVRFYGDVGIVTGRTVVTDEKGAIVRKTSFTDVFHWRDGRWQAVNGQETAAAKP